MAEYETKARTLARELNDAVEGATDKARAAQLGPREFHSLLNKAVNETAIRNGARYLSDGLDILYVGGGWLVRWFEGEYEATPVIDGHVAISQPLFAATMMASRAAGIAAKQQPWYPELHDAIIPVEEMDLGKEGVVVEMLIDDIRVTLASFNRVVVPERFKVPMRKLPDEAEAQAYIERLDEAVRWTEIRGYGYDERGSLLEGQSPQGHSHEEP